MQTASAGTGQQAGGGEDGNRSQPQSASPRGGLGGGLSEQVKWLLFLLFCSFHKGFHLTHDFPTSSFCSLRKQE